MYMYKDTKIYTKICTKIDIHNAITACISTYMYVCTQESICYLLETGWYAQHGCVQ